MRFRVASLFAALVPMAVPAQNTTLQALHNQARPLLIFAPGDNDVRVQQQLTNLIGHSADLRDRDMRVVIVPTASPTGTEPTDLPTASFATDEQQHARRRFHVGVNEFAVILVGKDGGEKLRSHSPLPWQRLSSTVDSMPMRKDEMRQR